MTMKPTRAQGFTLIEVMIALALGLLVVTAALAIFLSSSTNFRQDQQVAGLQDQLRFSVTQLSRDAEMAGFWAALLDPGVVTVDAGLGLTQDCGPAGSDRWMVTDRSPITVADNVTGSTANALFSCIAADEVVPGTDVLAIKRVAGRSMEGVSVEAGRIYLEAAGSLGTLYQHPKTGLGNVASQLWSYEPVIYFIRNYTETVGDGVPSLCRKMLSVTAGATGMATECVADGIENLQVEVGVDNGGDGKADRLLSAPSTADLRRATRIRVAVLARSRERDSSYRNEKTYRLGNSPNYTPADNLYREAKVTTVLLRNPTALLVLNP